MTRIFFCAGDVSGDEHSALVARQLLKSHPNWEIDAVGGRHLRQAGANIIGDSSNYGVIGFTSAMALLPKVLLLQRHVLHHLKSQRPDAALLCDWGAFNGRLLPHLQKLKIPVLYYFPPRSWQKTGDGGLSIAPLINAAATPFQWSAQRLKEAGAYAEWVGHPLLQKIERAQQTAGVRDKHQIALLPGSRELEWKWIAPHIAKAAEIIQRHRPRTYFQVAVPKGATARVQKYFSGVKNTHIVEGNTTKVLLESHLAIVKSGTSTLESAVCDTPQIIVYEASPLIHLQVALTGLRRKIRFVGMPNIIADKEIAPELLGENCRGKLIAEKVLLLMSDMNYRAQMRRDYREIRCALGEDLPFTATEKTAQMIEALLDLPQN